MDRSVSESSCAHRIVSTPGQRRYLQGRFGQIPGDDAAYTQVEPELGRRVWTRHGHRAWPTTARGQLIRMRPDLEVTDLESWS